MRSTIFYLMSVAITILLASCGSGDDSAPVNTVTETINVNGVSFTMVRVDGGTFMMGTSETAKEIPMDETPAHSVTLDTFYIGQTEVTQALWNAVMAENPNELNICQNIGEILPLESVSWEHFHNFITKLNQLTGKSFRLPTEAEWEFAARGGNYSKGYKYPGGNDLDDVAWWEDNSDDKTHEVATKKANELGLFDMAGNVDEWCEDWYAPYGAESQTNPRGPAERMPGVGMHQRVERGGSCISNKNSCRVTRRRSEIMPSCGNGHLGFRLAM